MLPSCLSAFGSSSNISDLTGALYLFCGNRLSSLIVSGSRMFMYFVLICSSTSSNLLETFSEFAIFVVVI